MYSVSSAVRSEPVAAQRYSAFSSRFRERVEAQPEQVDAMKSKAATPMDHLHTQAMYGNMPSRGLNFSRSTTAFGGVRGAMRSGFNQAGMNLGISVGVYGGFSLFKQTVDVFQGKQSSEGALAIVVADVLRSGMVGLGASAGGNLTDLAIQTTRMAGGMAGSILTIIGGAVGASLGRQVIDAVPVKDKMLELLKDEDPPQLAAA